MEKNSSNGWKFFAILFGALLAAVVGLYVYKQQNPDYDPWEEPWENSSSPVDLGILSSHKEAVNALCFIYGVPVDLYYGQSKYENAKEAKKSLYEGNAIPLANEFGADLLAHFGMDGEYRLTVNTDKISVLQDDPADVLDNLNKMHATLNELREAYGYEPRPEPWADLPMIPMATVFGGEGVNDIDETNA